MRQDEVSSTHPLTSPSTSTARLSPDAPAHGASGPASPPGARPPERAAETHVAGPATSPEQGLVIRTDKRRVERIIVNLVENALRHGATPIAIDVGVVREHRDDDCGVLVGQRGIGHRHGLPEQPGFYYGCDTGLNASNEQGEFVKCERS